MSDTEIFQKHELDLPKVGAYATSAQLCNRFQVSRTTWWRWSQQAGFPPAIRIGRSVRWSTEAVESFLTRAEG
ncbi:helix-turn-helix transcriptional regulator [Pseudomonas sp. MAHUQ-62]|uniref:helix-turn-helix transcriptional regulator n=1 Tax=Pseudomonas sp. GCM10023245 TaxID=3252652 RepID=UPI00360B4C2C